VIALTLLEGLLAVASAGLIGWWIARRGGC
jgi:hypothetical protein